VDDCRRSQARAARTDADQLTAFLVAIERMSLTRSAATGPAGGRSYVCEPKKSGELTASMARTSRQ
jgi:hypothetical protein